MISVLLQNFCEKVGDPFHIKETWAGIGLIEGCNRRKRNEIAWKVKQEDHGGYETIVRPQTVYPT